MSETLPMICLMGPTASGKTGLAIALTEHFPCDIISVDSAMVYRGMDIGTATPSPDELAKAPHRLINLCDPTEHYSAGRFCEDALREIKAIHQQGRIPLLVGGTMLYFHLLQQGFLKFPASDPAVRARIEAQAKERGWSALHDKLKKIDPVAASRIHPNDPQRLSRALELFYSTGKTMTTLQAEQDWEPLPYKVINMIIEPSDRPSLHQRIEKRFRVMMSEGLLDEVKDLHARGDLHAKLPAMRMVNYRQLWAYLEGELDLGSACERAVIATRQLAKRQLTWLRRWDRAFHLKTESPKRLDQALEFLKRHL